jgi:integrase/recombinase XerD
VIEYMTGELILPGENTQPPARRGDVAPVHEQIRNRWLLSLHSRNTEAAYARDIDTFFDWCREFGFDPLRLGRAHADGYHRFLGERLAASTRARKLAVVSSFFRYAMTDSPDLVPANPMTAVKRPTVSKKSQTVGLTIEQAVRLFDAAEQRGPWEHAMVRVLLHTGMRVSELIHATTADLRREGTHTTIRIKRKGGEVDRIPLPQEAVDAIHVHLAGRTGPILQGLSGGEVTRQEVARVLARLAKSVGLPSLTPHVLRHTAATLAILHGGPDGKGLPVEQVQEMLGHSVITTTMRYVHAAGRVDRSAVHGLAAAYRRAQEPCRETAE